MVSAERSAVAERRVAVFFYGSFINLAVLKRLDYVPAQVEVARLWGFDLRFAPLATLETADAACVYGILVSATHAELARLYGEAWVSSYVPEAVVVETVAGRWSPALVYIAWGATPPRPFDQYVEHILEPARQYRFPDWYLRRIREMSELST
jgi:hypothetical protein